MTAERNAPSTEYVVSVTQVNRGARVAEWVLRRPVPNGYVECSRDDPADAAAFALADDRDYLSLPTGDYPLMVPRPAS